MDFVSQNIIPELERELSACELEDHITDLKRSDEDGFMVKAAANFMKVL